MVYETGSGKYPLWESVALRPVFRELFVDWRNTDWQSTDEANNQLDFPSLGDAPSPDPNFPTSIYFDTAQSDLTADDKLILDGIAEFLLGDPLSHLAHIAGHTDRVGTDDDNQILSLARANKVFDYLRNKGIEASRLTVSAHGEMQPVVPTDDGVEEAKNRRVELTVFDLTPTELPSFATPFGPEVEDNEIEIPIPEALEQIILDGVEQLVDFAARSMTRLHSRQSCRSLAHRSAKSSTCTGH